MSDSLQLVLVILFIAAILAVVFKIQIMVGRKVDGRIRTLLKEKCQSDA